MGTTRVEVPFIVMTEQEKNFRNQVFLINVRALLGIHYENNGLSEEDQEFASWLLVKITAFQKANADDDKLRVVLQRHRMTLINLGAKEDFEPRLNEVTCRLRVFEDVIAELYRRSIKHPNHDVDQDLISGLWNKMTTFSTAPIFLELATDTQRSRLTDLIEFIRD